MEEKKNSIVSCVSRSIIVLFILAVMQGFVFAQTSSEMAKELENLYSKGEVTTISFTLDGDKTSLSFAKSSSKFRVETPHDLITSDGFTIWHLDKKKQEVVIDKISSKGSSLANAEDLIKFSTNYSSVLSHKHNNYELKLTPSASISKIMESIGGISLLTFDLVKPAHGTLQIKKIMARSAKKDFTIGNVKIKSLAKADNSLFEYKASKGVKVIDLRD
jgi:outer membrane lipoprotein-sorting protein